MRLDLVGEELDQVDSIWGRTRWGRTRHGAKPAATVLSFSFVVIHTTFLFYSMQFDQSENFFTDYMQGNLLVRLSKYTLQYLMDDGEENT